VFVVVPPRQTCQPLLNVSQSFYNVYDTLFEKLAKQEEAAHEERSAGVWADDDGEATAGSARTFPRYGSSYDVVNA
jgi:hypothetical protein